MNLHVNKLGNTEYQAVLRHPSGIEILGPARNTQTPEAAIEALADMVVSWSDEIPATLPQHKGWLAIAAALKAKAALSENPDPSAST